MTQPDPTPGAPAGTDSPPPSATPPAPAASGAAPAPSGPTEDIGSLPEWAQKSIRDARAEAAKSRTTAKQTAAEQARQEVTQQIARALGLGEEGQPVDPAQLTSQIEQAQAAAWKSGVQLQVYRLAGSLGANPDALLDSLAFIDSLDDLIDVDPSAADFGTQLEAKVRAAVERNPAYRVAGQAPAGTGTPRPDPSQGSRGSAPDLDALIKDAQSKGNFREVIRLQTLKLQAVK